MKPPKKSEDKFSKVHSFRNSFGPFLFQYIFLPPTLRDPSIHKHLKIGIHKTRQYYWIQPQNISYPLFTRVKVKISSSIMLAAKKISWWQIKVLSQTCELIKWN